CETARCTSTGASVSCRAHGRPCLTLQETAPNLNGCDWVRGWVDCVGQPKGAGDCLGNGRISSSAQGAGGSGAWTVLQGPFHRAGNLSDSRRRPDHALSRTLSDERRSQDQLERGVHAASPSVLRGASASLWRSCSWGLE